MHLPPMDQSCQGEGRRNFPGETRQDHGPLSRLRKSSESQQPSSQRPPLLAQTRKRHAPNDTPNLPQPNPQDRRRKKYGEVTRARNPSWHHTRVSTTGHPLRCRQNQRKVEKRSFLVLPLKTCADLGPLHASKAQTLRHLRTLRHASGSLSE